MADSADEPSADALLAHAGFIRALARSLVADEATADDVVQQTLIAALERPPREGSHPRAWLATVARNFARKAHRGARRRTRREERAARPEQLASPAEVAARLELERKVVAAVHALAEPYRSAVVHRFFDDKTPEEIARATATPVETVRTRLRRALRKLRERLDADHGGNRHVWTLGLLAILATHRTTAAATAGAGSLLAGVSALTAKHLLATLVVALVFATILLVTLTGSDRSRRAVPAVDNRVPAVAGPGTEPEEQTPATASPAGATVGERFALAGVVVDPAGAPIPGARVGLLDAYGDWSSDVAQVSTDALGRFVLGLAGPSPVRVAAIAEGFLRARVHADPLDEAEIALTLAPGAGLTLRVVGPGGDPVADAAVTVQSVVEEGVSGLYWSSRSERLARENTDDEGLVVVDAVPPGDLQVEVEATGFAPARVHLRVRDTAPFTHVVRLTRGAVVTGRVFDTGGNHVVGARVFVEGFEGCAATSGADGGYRLEGVPEGESTIAADAPGFARGYFAEAAGWDLPVALRLRAGQVATGIDVVLNPAVYLRGRIVDEEGRPVEGVRVHGYSHTTSGLRYSYVAGQALVTTAADGRFRAGPFRRVGNTVVRLWFTTGRVYLPSLEWPVPEGAHDVDVGDVEAQRLATVRGRVVDEDGAPVARARVRLAGGDAAHAVGPDGRFVLEGVAPVRILLYAEGAGVPRTQSPLVLWDAGAQEGEIALQLSAAMHVAGRVATPEGAPRAGLTVGAAPLEGPRPPSGVAATATTDAEGRFAFPPLARGAYRIGLFDFGEMVQDPEPVTVRDDTAGLELLAPLRGAVVTGRVLARDTKEPVAGFVTNCIRYEWFIPQGVESSRHAGREGRFSQEISQAGTWAVEVKAPGFATLRTRPVSVAAGGTADFGDILLGRGGSVEGMVHDLRGEPVPHARIHILSASLETNEDAPFTDLEGRFALAGLTPGTYTLFAVSPRHPLGIVRPVEVKEGETVTANVPLASATPLTILVRDSAGQPVEGAEVSYAFDAIRPLTSNEIRSYEPPGWGAHETDAEGRLVKPALPATHVTLTIEKDGFLPVSRTVDLTAGEPATLEIALQR